MNFIKMLKLITATSVLIFTSISFSHAVSMPCGTAKLIVPWGAGGGTDVIFRQMVDKINKNGAKPQLQVVNVGGQGGNKGAKQASKAKPDGCTLFAIHQSAITSYFTGRIDITWDAFETISMVSEIFPEGSTAFFNSVIMPRNFDHIENVIKFATKIGWGVSLVPVHVSDPAHPLPYRTLDYDGTMDFKNHDEENINNFVIRLKKMKKNFNLYDSDEYLDDVARFILKKPIIRYF